jgi:hypothetical protein
MDRKYYVYQYTLETDDGIVAYVGQAKKRTRALQHLTNSSNEDLQFLLGSATKWPLVQVFDLEYPCAGDLQVFEAALISDAVDSARSVGDGTFAKCLNGKREDGAEWLHSSNFPAGDLDTVLEKGRADDEGEGHWILASWPLCRPDENGKSIKKSLKRARIAADNDRRAGLRQGFNIFPKAGSEIVRLGVEDLRSKLDHDGRGSALIVYINGDRLSDGRDPFGPGATVKSLTERCVKYWPTSIKATKRIGDDVPDTLIAVTGGSRFRLILGAWKIVPDVHCLASGNWHSRGQIKGWAGNLLDERVKYVQSAYPSYVLDSEGEMYWSAAGKIRS